VLLLWLCWMVYYVCYGVSCWVHVYYWLFIVIQQSYRPHYSSCPSLCSILAYKLKCKPTLKNQNWRGRSPGTSKRTGNFQMWRSKVKVTIHQKPQLEFQKPDMGEVQFWLKTLETQMIGSLLHLKTVGGWWYWFGLTYPVSCKLVISIVKRVFLQTLYRFSKMSPYRTLLQQHIQSSNFCQ